jgi:protein-disulfide isomerase-like protein with CxxC motif
LKVFAINGIDRDKRAIEVFIHDRGMAYPTLLDTNRSITKSLKINAFPTLVLIESGSRKVVWVSYGHDASTETELGEVLSQYLK